MEKGNFIVAWSSSTDCVRCGTGWGGALRNALITQLCCPALTSCPTFCLQLETKTKKRHGFQPFLIFYTTHGGMQIKKRLAEWEVLIVLGFQEDLKPPRLPILVLLSCYDRNLVT